MTLQNIPILQMTFRANGDVVGRRAIGFTGAQIATRGQKVFGISPRSAALDGYSDVTVVGTEIVEAGAAFARGDSLVADATGRAVVVNASANPAEYIFADALEAATAAGQLVEVLLRR